MSFKIRNIIADGPLDQSQIDQQLQSQKEVGDYSYKQTLHSNKLAELQREVAKINQIKQALRTQEEYVARLNVEIDRDYESNLEEQNRREPMMYYNPKTGKSERLFPDLSDSSSEKPKKNNSNSSRKIIGYSVDASGRTIKRIPIFEDSEPTSKKSLGRTLKNGEWF